VQFLHARQSMGQRIERLPVLVRWPGYVAAVFAVVLFGVYRATQFIYFQF
jgi:hypothetical protein